MEYEGSQQTIMQKEIHEKEEGKISEKESPIFTPRDKFPGKTVLNRSSKNKSKFTLRPTKSQKTSRRKSKSKIMGEDALVPYIPRRVFRVFSILRHRNFFKVVSKLFKPTHKTPAWNFKSKSRDNRLTTDISK